MEEQKYAYPGRFVTCPYCGEKNKACSEITSMTRAYARAQCRKLHNGVTIQELSKSQWYDPEPEV
jgi:hypothetical protein